LFQGNREALDGFSDEKAAQFVALLVRLIANLDRRGGAGPECKNHGSTDFGTASGI
jgi:hypothetical protein